MVFEEFDDTTTKNSIYILNKPAVHAAGSNPSQYNSTVGQNYTTEKLR